MLTSLWNCWGVTPAQHRRHSDHLRSFDPGAPRCQPGSAPAPLVILPVPEPSKALQKSMTYYLHSLVIMKRPQTHPTFSHICELFRPPLRQSWKGPYWSCQAPGWARRAASPGLAGLPRPQSHPTRFANYSTSKTILFEYFLLKIRSIVPIQGWM